MAVSVSARRWAGVYIGLGLLLLMLAGCSATPLTQQLTQQPADRLPTRVELHGTPFFPQEEYHCGPAALATVLNHHGVGVQPDQLAPRVYLPQRHGSLQLEMTAAARDHGMLAYPLPADLETLLREVAAGHPVLVLQNLRFAWWPQWHYAVVVGYDLQAREILLRSGTTKRWRTTLATFERTWARGKHWAQVLLPAGQVPVTAEPAPYLQAAFDLEQTGHLEPAHQVYLAATRRWPQRPELWLALGNSAFAQQDYGQAERAFRHAVQLAPEQARSWNNLAYAAARNGCVVQAQQAAQCALKRAPDDANLRATLEEMQALDETSLPEAANTCRPVACRSD